MKTNGAAALIRALQDLGVKQVFGLPGVQNAAIYDALIDSDISHVLARHEQAAVHMADGYARATGTVGVVLATSGPGATNTVTGIATAYMDSVPVVVITGQVSTAFIGTDAFQEADITTITLPITKHSYLLKDVEELVPSVFEAFYLAASGRPGPVLIDIPSNVASSVVHYQAPASALTSSIPSYRPTIKGNARQVKAAAELVAQAERPVFLAGGGVVSSDASSVLVSLAEHCAIPVVTTLLAKGVIAAAHPLFLGQPGVYGASKANNALQQADLIIAVGTRFSERVTGNAAGFAPAAKIIHIDIDPAEIGKNIRVDVPIVGDAVAVLTALEERLVGREGNDAQDIKSRRVVSGELAETLDAFADNITHYVFSTLGALLRERKDILITADVGQHQLWASHLLGVDAPRHFLTSGGLGTMGFGMPAALGAQLANPNRLVLCISGDGSFQMNIQEMAVAVVHKLPIKVAIINNRSLGLVRQYQELFLEERYAHTALDPVPDYPRLAEAYGWQGRTLDALKDKAGISDALRWLFETDGPALLNIEVPAADLLIPMVRPGGTLTEVVDG